MKTQIKMKNIPKILLATVLAAGLWACTADPVETVRGSIGDKESLGATYGILRSAVSAGNTVPVPLTVGASPAVQQLYFEQTQPAAAAVSVTLRVDEELVATFNAANETACELLPAANYDFPDGTTLSVAAGKQQSAPLRISLKADGLTAGTYLLPVTVAAAGESDASQTLYYAVSVREPYIDSNGYDLHDGSDLFFVFYINTKDYQPLLAQDYILQKWNLMTADVAWYCMIGNIINLRTVTIQYAESTSRALLDLGTDMTYVLDHATKYIRPLQEQGRRVCLSLEGGGTGLGFCNLSDEQIADFVAQVKAVVETYNLDGINLWDRNAGYGKEGMPETNTTSYPKLIKAMREALGTDKLLTLTVYEEPTSTFWDTEATGGIVVGEYLDYAWSGYNKNTEAVQLLDPWHPDESYISAYTQKPIAGLDASKFGCINFPIYPGTSDSEELLWRDPAFIMDWVNASYMSNNIIVFEDLRTNLQDGYETQWDRYFATFCQYMDLESRYYLGSLRGYRYNFEMARLSLLPSGASGYGKWLKDW
ncbi:MAG TPA: DUF1735 domain-containing protein [Candidatus Alistipes intestinigallinarum]|uniref:DUF1735 domain-containing protein n=1 Tax=Candidatus Alistipes intestinigallinarum TaxID=2838440 RepID=A0A9D1Z231_9BACT|nr:DUF1735 domain-containing protein [Candidatus Alistipes intestinigallinarum]